MIRNWRVYTKVTARASWKDTGIIESNREAAQEIWASIITRLHYHDFKLEPITYGVAIER